MELPADIQELTRRATKGEAKAQYALAARLSGAGRRDEAENWLQSAARLGEPDALYTIAARRMHTREGLRAAMDDLARAANGGSAAARRLECAMCASGLAGAADERTALAGITALAKAGDPAAIREIAALLALRDRDDADVGPLLALAAGGDIPACAVLVARAGAGRDVGDAPALAAAKAALASIKYPRADKLAAAAKGAGAQAGCTLDWAAIEQRLTLETSPQTPGKALLGEPPLTLLADAVPAEICEYLIAHAAPRLGPSLIYDPIAGGMRRDPLRTSMTASLGPVDLDLVVVALARRIARMAALPAGQGEFISVLRYGPGQEYLPHYDCIPAGPDLDRNGQRITTALLYLNDEYEGGETRFLVPDFNVKGAVGDVIVFSNVEADGGVRRSSRHAGLAITAGQKWLASTWYRDREFDF